MARGYRLPRLLKAFQSEVESSGGLLDGEVEAARRPARVLVESGGRRRDLILYIWSLSPDGPTPPRPPGRHRIQMTGITAIEFRDGWRTAIAGYDAGRNVHVFWDAGVHSFFSSGSPSLHVKTKTVEFARSEGIAFEEKTTPFGRETVVAVHGPRLLGYLLEGADCQQSPTMGGTHA